MRNPLPSMVGGHTTPLKWCPPEGSLKIHTQMVKPRNGCPSLLHRMQYRNRCLGPFSWFPKIRRSPKTGVCPFWLVCLKNQRAIPGLESGFMPHLPGRPIKGFQKAMPKTCQGHLYLFKRPPTFTPKRGKPQHRFPLPGLCHRFFQEAKPKTGRPAPAEGGHAALREGGPAQRRAGPGLPAGGTVLPGTFRPRHGARVENVRWPWVSQNQWDPILGWVNSPPILEPILLGMGMFTGGTGFLPVAIWWVHVGAFPHGLKG